MKPTAARIAIPFGQASLHGYLFRAADDGQPRPTLIINGGYDSTAEESWFFSGAAAVARGYTAIAFDGPGQGAAIIEDKIVFRPDWEAVVGPVIDYALTRPEVDSKKIALMGISFGGYLAPRAASADGRLAACIADPGEYSLSEEMKTRMPAFVARALQNESSAVLSLTQLILRRRLRHTTAGWGLRRGMWVHGVKSPLDYLRLLKDYTLEGRAEHIRCPTLVCSAANDEIGVTARKLYEKLTCEKSFIAFTAEEGRRRALRVRRANPLQPARLRLARRNPETIAPVIMATTVVISMCYINSMSYPTATGCAPASDRRSTQTCDHHFTSPSRDTDTQSIRSPNAFLHSHRTPRCAGRPILQVMLLFRKITKSREFRTTLDDFQT
jgi:pimeloyl-ACP methyl ester carboxylesterase